MGVNQVLETVPLISVLMLIGAEVGGGPRGNNTYIMMGLTNEGHYFKVKPENAGRGFVLITAATN